MERATPTTHPADDAALIEAAARGDRVAFSGLYGRYAPRVMRRLSHLVGPRGPVEDLLQETFLRAMQAMPRFRRGSPFDRWLLRIATNCAFDQRRRERRSLWRLFAAPEEIDDAVERRQQGADRYPELDAVHRALRGLSPKLCEVVVLFDLEGMSLAEIADELGIPLATVASRVRRGREQLRAQLEPERGRRDQDKPLPLSRLGERA